MTLELFSATGALIGGLVAFLIDEQVLAGLFAALLVWVALSMARRRDPAPSRAPAGAADGGFPNAAGEAEGAGDRARGGGGAADDDSTNAAAEPDDAEHDAEAGMAAELRLPERESRTADASRADAVPAPMPATFAASISGPGYVVHRVPAGAAGSVVAGLN